MQNLSKKGLTVDKYHKINVFETISVQLKSTQHLTLKLGKNLLAFEMLAKKQNRTHVWGILEKQKLKTFDISCPDSDS